MNFTNVSFHSDRLSLCSFLPTDAAEIFAGITPSLTRLMAFEPSNSPQAFAKIWQQWLHKMARGTDLFLVLRLRQTGEFLGLCGVHDMSLDIHGRYFSEPEAGIWIKESAHRQGYGYEAVSAAISWVSSACGIRTFIYPVASANLASRRIAESLHAEWVGTDRLIKPNDNEHPILVYRIPVCQK